VTTQITPFLKWPGGKRWFVHKHADVIPKHYKRYVEPFLGGGSVFFHLQPKKAILGDVNPDVVNAYRELKYSWEQLQASLEYRQRAHNSDQDYFYKLRSRVPKNDVQRASRMIYLNRTCFNGIYRVNLQGQFNVPRGSKDEVFLESDNFEATSNLLRNADIRLSDFEPLINAARAGDLIFADPPYTVRHNLNGFVKYNEVLFRWQDQERLSFALRRARDRGVKIVLTNANHESIRALYDGFGFELRSVSRFSQISASAKSRRQFEELIILSDTNEDLIK
jgi:DNA adenine methylase